MGWSRRRKRWGMAIVLPGLLLRALIPLGFMPMFGPGFSAQLTLCEGYAPVASMPMGMSKDMLMNMPMNMPVPARQHASGGSGKDGATTHQDHSACPYGASPAFAALVTLTCVPASNQALDPSLISSPQVAHFEISPRAQSPRGPPLQV